MAKRVSSPDLIGRTEELAALTAALERAASGDFGAILIAGEAGVGKTRLVAELERHATTAGGRVLAGDCIELAEGELPFAPLTAALRPLARELGPAELDALPGREELARLLPELGDPGDGWISRDSALDAPLAQSRLFEVLLALFTRLGESGPVVLTIEDMHWADRSTRDFLSFLIRNAHDARLLLVCTYRSDELHRRHPLRPFLAELERRAVVERLELAPLSRAELRGLLVAILGDEPSETLVGDMFERTDGNPFFAEELLAASAECTEIPATLRDALMVRVEALPQQARSILRVAAAAGRNVSHPLLAEVCALGDTELDEALREAVSSNVLVQNGDHYSFRHALVREAVSSDMLPGERTKLHAELAEALAADPSLGEGRAGAAAEVAHHWWEAKRLPEALTSSVAASSAAEEVYAFAEAHRFLEHALEIWDQVDDAEQRAGTDRAEIFARAAENANLIGELGRSVALARRAIELVDGDPVRLALLHERLGRYLWVTGDAEAALASYHEAVDLMPPEPTTAELAKVLAAHGQILMLRGRPRESRRRCEQAIEVARSVGARAEEGHALNTLGVDISSLGDRKTGIAHLREAKRIAEELGWIDEIGRVYVNLSEEIDWDGRTADAADLAFEGADVMRRHGARSYVAFLETEVAQRQVRLGRLDDAETTVRRINEAGAYGLGATICGDAEADIALARGELEKAAEAVARARSGLGRTRDSMFYGPTAAIEVEVAVTRSADEGVRAFEEALERLAGAEYGEEYAFSTARLYARGIRAYAEAAERARALGDDDGLERAERGAAAALERFDGVLAPELYEEGSPAPTALAHHAVAAAELTRLEGRSNAAAWATAAERWSALEIPLERAYAEWRQAEALMLASEGRSEAAELLSRAARSTREAGATALLGEIESLARRARLSLDGPQPVAAEDGDRDSADRLGLTERESEVLELVAQGCTNREIGETLFISEKTASVHVSRILGKLGVRGRVEAATKAQRLGIFG